MTMTAHHAADAVDAIDPMDEYISQAWSLNGQLPLLILIAILLGLGKGGVPGFATVATAATVATSPTNIVGGLGYAVALQVPILTMIDISASYLHYKDLDLQTIKLLLPMSFVGMIFGTYLDKHLSDQSSRLLVGMFLLLIMIVQGSKDYIAKVVTTKKQKSFEKKKKRVVDKKSSGYSDDIGDDGDDDEHADLETANGGGLPVVSQPPKGLRRRAHHDSADSYDDDEIMFIATNDVVIHSTDKTTTNNKKSSTSKTSSTTKSTTTTKLDKRTQYIWACVVGIVGGAATMLTNAMGPILNVYLLSVVQLSPTAYIGTRALFFCFLNVGKIPMRFLNGTLALKMIPLATFLGMVSVVGVRCAKPIMLSMSESNFVKLELAFVAFSGLRLCYMGLYG